jgi:hypothetical protein
MFPVVILFYWYFSEGVETTNASGVLKTWDIYTGNIQDLSIKNGEE